MFRKKTYVLIFLVEHAVQANLKRQCDLFGHRTLSVLIKRLTTLVILDSNINSGFFSNQEIDRLLDDLASMKSSSITMRPPLRRRLPKYLPDEPFDRDRIILEHIFHKPFINNSLMRLLYQIFCLTAELSQ